MKNTSVSPIESPEEIGSTAAALLAAGIGTFVMGMVTLLNAIRAISLTALVPSVGSLSTKVTVSLVAWLLAWAILHKLLAGRALNASRIPWPVGLLVALGVLGTFPPVWKLLGG